MGRRWWPLIGAVLAASQVHAQDLGSARDFTLRLYAAYAHGDADLDRRAGVVFAPKLLRLIRRDEATTPAGDEGALDWDPICSCQDADGLKVSRISLHPLGPGRVRADVALRFTNDTAAVGLDLVAVHGAWRIADIHTKDTPSLVAYLERSARETSAKAR
jgi:hypothetical protein